jgi:hypothetical protein
VALKAADLDDLPGGPNVGTSETRVLDVVTPDELRRLLEDREAMLRQRFEAIIQEVTESRDLLARMDFAPPKKPAAKTAAKPAEKATPDKSAVPVEEPAEPSVSTPQRRLADVQQLVQNSRKNAHETLGVAEAFDDIRQQLTNNRVDTEELKNRLGPGIAEPLHRIAEQMFPEFERRLETLQKSVADAKLGPQRRDVALAQAEDILTAMQQVLRRMEELQSYNELVEKLRRIIKSLEQIQEETKARHKQQIRDSLEK